MLEFWFYETDKIQNNFQHPQFCSFYLFLYLLSYSWTTNAPRDLALSPQEGRHWKPNSPSVSTGPKFTQVYLNYNFTQQSIGVIYPIINHLFKSQPKHFLKIDIHWVLTIQTHHQASEISSHIRFLNDSLKIWIYHPLLTDEHTLIAVLRVNLFFSKDKG